MQVTIYAFRSIHGKSTSCSQRDRFLNECCPLSQFECIIIFKSFAPSGKYFHAHYCIQTGHCRGATKLIARWTGNQCTKVQNIVAPPTTTIYDYDVLYRVSVSSKWWPRLTKSLPLDIRQSYECLSMNKTTRGPASPPHHQVQACKWCNIRHLNLPPSIIFTASLLYQLR